MYFSFAANILFHFNEMMKARCLCLFVFLLSTGVVKCRICTRNVSEKQTKLFSYRGGCIQTYYARCGWFDTRMCPQNETVECVKHRNVTTVTYRTVKECCPGYFRHPDGECTNIISEGATTSSDSIVNNQSLNITDVYFEIKAVGRQDVDENDNNDGPFWGISHGVYAGISCGILFVACVALLTAMHYKKRHKRLDKLNRSSNAGQENIQHRELRVMNSSTPLQQANVTDTEDPLSKAMLPKDGSEMETSTNT